MNKGSIYLLRNLVLMMIAIVLVCITATENLFADGIQAIIFILLLSIVLGLHIVLTYFSTGYAMQKRSYLVEDHIVRLKFNDFKKYYYLNPDKYTINNYGVTRSIQDNSYRNYHWVGIVFSCIGFIQFWIWLNHSQVDNKDIISLLEEVQNDINALKIKACNELNESNKLMEELKNKDKDIELKL